MLNVRIKKMYSFALVILLSLITIGTLSRETILIAGDSYSKIIVGFQIGLSIMALISFIYLKAIYEEPLFIRIIPKTKKFELLVYIIFALIYIVIIFLILMIVSLLPGLLVFVINNPDVMEYMPITIVSFLPIIGNMTFSSMNLFSIIMSGEVISYIVYYFVILLILIINLIIAYVVGKKINIGNENNSYKLWLVLYHVISLVYLLFTIISFTVTLILQKDILNLYIILSNYFFYVFVLEIVIVIININYNKKIKPEN